MDDEKVELELWVGSACVVVLINPEDFYQLEGLGYGYRYLDRKDDLRLCADLEPQFLRD